jgi:sulfur-carrier protein adenylyltransferase/sulfurtransferase
MDINDFYSQAFGRNIGLLTQKEQDKLRNSRIAIAGVGGVGGFHLINLVRLGIGKFTIADMDAFEPANIQRQCGAFMDTFGRNKAETMSKIALSINPHLEIRTFTDGVNKNNLDDFFQGADVFIDGIDFFSIEERRFIFRKARENGIYAITAGPLGFGSAMLIFSPTGMSFDEYFDLKDSMTYIEKIVAFGVGLAPAMLQMNYLKLGALNLKAKSGPSLVSACTLCSSLAATETLKILLKRKRPRPAPFYFQFDPYLHELKTGVLLFGNRNWLQLLKRWYLTKICS